MTYRLIVSYPTFAKLAVFPGLGLPIIGPEERKRYKQENTNIELLV